MTQRDQQAKPRPDSDGLSDTDIAHLCDIGEFSSAAPDAEEARRIERLIAEGFVELAGPAKAPAKYQLTAKAQKFLSERGAGLNEA